MNTTQQRVTLKDVMDHVLKMEERLDHIDERMTSPGHAFAAKRMTDDDARRILLGDLKDMTNRECAELLHLSYGQVYSARNGYTFMPIYNEYKAEMANEESK
jgi:hypothetical protein